MAGIQFEFGRCGFGLSAGLFPEFRAGLVRVTILSLPAIKTLQEHNDTLRAARDALVDWKRKWGREATRSAQLEKDLSASQESLRTSESARAQLELDLQTAVADKGKCLAYAWDAIARNHDLEARLARFNRKVDPVTKRFVKVGA